MSCELLDCAGDELELWAAGDVEVDVEPVGELQLEAHPHQVSLLLSRDVDDEPEEDGGDEDEHEEDGGDEDEPKEDGG